MERRVRKGLLKEVLEAHIEWHSRKGLRVCDCDYCLIKKAGTHYIGYTPFPLGRYKEEIAKLRGNPGSSPSDYDELARDIVREERERKRRIVRRLLHAERTKGSS